MDFWFSFNSNAYHGVVVKDGIRMIFGLRDLMFEYEYIEYIDLMLKYNINLYFSIIDAKLMFVEIDSTSAWR